MKEKVLKRKLKQEISRLIKEKEANSYKASENDPSNSCAGRGVCCIGANNQYIEAPFKMDHNKKVICNCPQGSRKIA